MSSDHLPAILDILIGKLPIVLKRDIQTYILRINDMPSTHSQNLHSIHQ